MVNQLSNDWRFAMENAALFFAGALVGSAVYSSPLPKIVSELASNSNSSLVQLLSSPEVVSGAVGLVATAVPALLGLHYQRSDTSRETSIKIGKEHGQLAHATLTPERKHALLILGDPQGKTMRVPFHITGQLVYESLLSQGFRPQDVYMLTHQGKAPFAFDGAVAPATKQSLEEVMSHLANEVTPNDSFFLYVLSHGSKEGTFFPVGKSGFDLQGVRVDEAEFERLLAPINPKYSVLYFNNCFSGGFAKRLGKDRTVAISTSRPDKVTWGGKPKELHNYASAFTYFFFSALKGIFPDGTPVSLASPNIESAFDYASEQSAQIKPRGFNARLWGNFKNTPHLVYGQVEPSSIHL